MERGVMLQKGLEDNWKDDDARKGGCGFVSRLYILRNSAKKAQSHVKRETNKQLPRTFLFCSPLDGREADADDFEESTLGQILC